ncbi:MAG: peptidoglycan bridge formation glycyltransferase FemA/FemB family protein [bacterium]
MIRAATNEEILNWDHLILKNPDHGHIYQSYLWGEYKAGYDWRPHRLIWENDTERVAVQLISKTAPGFGSLWYVPKAPGMFVDYKPGKKEMTRFKKFTNELTDYISKHDKSAYMIMIDPELLDGSFNPKQAGWEKSHHDLQFKATIIVDIDQDDEALLSSFKQKTRYNIRLATKKGVIIEKRPATDEMVDTMYDLMRATQGRAGFFLRPKEAFKAYWQLLAESGLGQFFVAVHEGEILAAEYAMIFGDKAYYKEGGSSGVKRNLMAPYLLQYEVMRWARDKGAKEYDLIAVPPKSKLNPEHSMWGLYQFKSGFNEEITEFIGGWEYPLKPKVYTRWLKLEPWFHRVYHRVKHNLFW